MRTILAVVLGLGALALLAGAVLYSGLYDVSASRPHAPLVEELIETALRRSVARRASGLAAPELSDESRVAEGLEHYAAMCEVCHGAPEGSPSDVAEGLYPKPPRFAEERLDWSDGELFWITKHGLKLTGMPAFGESHTDDEIWSLVAALRRLPELDAAAYRAATGAEATSAEEGAHDHSAHSH